MKPFHTLLFDFDGTLMDSLPVVFQAFRAVFQKYKQRTLTDEEIIALFGPHETEIFRLCFPPHMAGEVIEYYYKTYAELHAAMVSLDEPVLRMLHKLRDQGYRTGLVTGKAARSMHISLEQLKIAHLFDVLIAGDSVANNKPHPDGILKALEILGVPKQGALMAGDSDFDILAGRDAGITTVGVQWFQVRQSEVFTVQPDYIVESIEAFWEILA